MPIQFVPYTPEWEPAVERFNRRMREGKAPSAFTIPDRAAQPETGAVRAQYILAAEEAEVRGSMIIQEHPGFLNNSGQEGGSARRENVINIQSPLSEGIINAKYAMVSIQLIRFALKRCPYVYVVGMGRIENPLPRLLKASGWNVRPAPFFFRVLRAARCLSELRPLQRSAALRTAALAGAYTGAGAVALHFVQRARVSAAGYRTAPAEGADATDDRVWAEVEKRISFGIVRDSSTLPDYLAQDVKRYRVYHGDEFCGWISMLISSMKDHSYFGNLKVATLIDAMAMNPAETGVFSVLAVDCARAAGCDLVVSNQLRTEAQNALRAGGFLSYGSNYLVASSKALSGIMDDATSLVSRQDGDGLVNLHGS